MITCRYTQTPTKFKFVAYLLLHISPCAYIYIHLKTNFKKCIDVDLCEYVAKKLNEFMIVCTFVVSD